MTIANPPHRSGPAALLARWERWLGADRPGRSRLVWLGPVFTAVSAFLMLAWSGRIGGLGVESWLPVALFGSLVLGGLSISYLCAFAADARDVDDEDRPRG